MKKTLKTIIVLSLSLLLLVSCSKLLAEPSDDFSTSITETEKPTPEKQFEFEAGEGGLVVTKYTGSDKKVIIPSVVENKKVVSLNADVFGGNIILEEIVMSENMTYIDLDDFEGCDNLVSITYPAKTIDDYNGTGVSLTNLVEIHFPNAKSLPGGLLARLYNKNDKLRTFDLRSLEELKLVRALTESSNGDLNLTLSENLIKSIKSSVASGYLYEEINYTAYCYGDYKYYLEYYYEDYLSDYEKYSDFLSLCENSNCTKNHMMSDEGLPVHVECEILPGVDMWRDGSDFQLDSKAEYILDSEAASFEEGLKSSLPFTIHDRSYGKYTDYSLSDINRFAYEEVLNECANMIFFGEVAVSGIKCIATTTEQGETHVIMLCTVTAGDCVFECVFGHERSVFLARRLIGNTSDVNIAITYTLGCNSVTINGTTYTANVFAPAY